MTEVIINDNREDGGGEPISLKFIKVGQFFYRGKDLMVKTDYDTYYCFAHRMSCRGRIFDHTSQGVPHYAKLVVNDSDMIGNIEINVKG